MKPTTANPTAQATKKFFTVADLMDRWSVSRTTLWREVQRSALRQTKVAGCIRFASSEVERYEKK